MTEATTTSLGELAKQQPGQKDIDLFTDLSKASDFLPRFQLCGSKTDLVTEEKIGMAHYALILEKDNFEDLGKQVSIFPISWRPKAIDMSDKGTVTTAFDADSEEFNRIRTKSGVKDSNCMFGIEFLIFIPLHGFALFFFGSKTQRKVAPDLRALMENNKCATLSAFLIDNGTYKWHKSVIVECSTPLPELPTEEDVKKQVEKFLNPPAPLTKVDETKEGDRDR